MTIDTAADNIAKVQGELATIDRIEAGFAVLAKEYPADVIVDVTIAKGMKEAIAARAAWRDPRIAVEKARKAAKAPVLELGRAIDARAASLTLRLEAGEAHYDGQIKAEEARKETERAAKVQQEVERVSKIQDYIEGIREHGTDAANLCPNSASIREVLEALEARQITQAIYQEFTEQAVALKEQTLLVVRQALARRVEQEAEATRIAAEREELGRLRAEQEARAAAESARIAAEQKAEAERLAQQRDEIDRRERAAAAEIERKQQAARAEQARLDAEAAAARKAADDAARAEREEADRIARAQRAAEQLRMDEQAASLRRQQALADEAARIERAAQEQAAQRVRAAAPAMFDALMQWRNAEDTNDSDELAAARISRDAALEAAGEILDVPY